MHGYGQNIELFQKYNSKLLTRLSKKYNTIYSQGTYNAPDYGEQGRSWWSTNDVYGDLVNSRDIDVNRAVNNIQPTNILCGYSQGGNIILHCLEKNPNICQLAIIINSLKGNVNTIIDTPIIFAFSESDPFIGPKERSDLLNISSKHIVLTHDKGHHIPQNNDFCGQLINAIETFI